MKVDLFQVYYEKNQPLDKGCIPINGIRKNVYPLFENQYILEQYPKLGNVDYSGVTSWRMHEKTELTKDKIDKFIETNPGYDVYIYSPYGDEYDLLTNTRQQTPLGRVWSRLFELNLFNHDLRKEKWVNVFCNYWLARKDIWNRYIPYLKKAIKLVESDPIIIDICNKNPFKHRDKNYPLEPFVLEYTFGMFLKDNPDITYKKITHMYSTESLLDIYNRNKTEFAGLGDKGTLHHYIENYENLFHNFRNEPINFLEIGVQEGYSLRMWREYFSRAKVIGIDIKPCPLPLEGCDFYICDQSNKEQLANLLKGQNFNIIVDDGSHNIEHQIASFEALFPRLNNFGIYVIEDIQNPETDIPLLESKFGKAEIYDTRAISGRYDDILLVWRKNTQ